MHPSGSCKCLHCGVFFRPDARNRRRQRYCHRGPCKQASKAASQRAWRRKPGNADYFKGSAHVARVQAWRQAHPGYWRRRERTRISCVTRSLECSRCCSTGESIFRRRGCVTRGLARARSSCAGTYLPSHRDCVTRRHRGDDASAALPRAGRVGHRRPGVRLCKNT